MTPIQGLAVYFDFLGSTTMRLRLIYVQGSVVHPDICVTAIQEHVEISDYPVEPTVKLISAQGWFVLRERSVIQIQESVGSFGHTQ